MTQPWTQARVEALVAGFLQPISTAAPGGVSAKGEKGYQTILAEVGKLESPSGGAVDWKGVTDEGQSLLASTSKDLLISCYVAFGLLRMKGLKGLLEGLAIVWGFVGTFWATGFPEVIRLRGRSNALDWLVTRVGIPLSSLKVGDDDRDTVEGLLYVSGLLQDLVRERFGAQAPALGPLTEALGRIVADLPALPDPEPTPPAPPPRPSPRPSPTGPDQTPPRPPPALPPPVEIGPHVLLPSEGAPVAAQLSFVGQVAEALVGVAKALRSARIDDPLPYRLLRAALWLTYSQAPEADEDGKTSLAPAPDDLVRKLTQLEEAESWHELLSACEKGLVEHPLALSLQRYAVTALAGLNLTQARLAVLSEVRALLGRLPALSAFRFSDGSPIIDHVTRDWLEANELLTYDSPRPKLAVKTSQPPPEPAIVMAQRAVSKGSGREALVQAAEALRVATSDRERFVARMVQAQACALSDNVALAAALYEKLDRELVARGIDQWDPPLAGQVLRGILSLRRPSAETPEAAWGGLLSRLFLVDPQAALDLKSPK
jgi:type VI secretion system protein VasJ